MKKWWREWLGLQAGLPEVGGWLDSLSKPQRLMLLWMCPEVRDYEHRVHRNSVMTEFDEWCWSNGYPRETHISRPFWEINPDSTPPGMGPAYKEMHARWHRGREGA